MSYEEREISIGEVRSLLEQGFEVEVDSPDGFVPVSMFVDKGVWDEYVLTLDDSNQVRVNENHLFETDRGWKYAKDIWREQTAVGYKPYQYVCVDGWRGGVVKRTGNKIPIVDIQVDHENHRYYTNGVSSHNTGVGKSLFMCHCAAANMVHGLSVLYITMEMAEERIAERIEANMLDVTMDDLTILPKDSYTKKIDRLKETVKGKLIIKEYPTSSAGSANFRHLLNELKLKRNFIPDIIYIDYLNICASSRLKQGANVNSYTYIKSIAEELRGLAVEFNVPIVSATQTTRSGYSNSDVGLEDTSESFGLPATVDFMFALMSNDELAEMNQMLVKQLKNRYADPGRHRKFVIGVDKTKMRLYDAEQHAQQDLIDTGPAFDNTDTGVRIKQERKFDRNTFEGFK